MSQDLIDRTAYHACGILRDNVGLKELQAEALFLDATLVIRSALQTLVSGTTTPRPFLFREKFIQSESALHDCAFAVATILTTLQQQTPLQFGQLYLVSMDGIKCFEMRMADIRRRLHPSKN